MKFSIRELCLVTVCAALAVNSCRLESRMNEYEALNDQADKVMAQRQDLLWAEAIWAKNKIFAVEVHNRWQDDRLQHHRHWLVATNNNLEAVEDWVVLQQAKEGAAVSSQADEVQGCPKALWRPSAPTK